MSGLLRNTVHCILRLQASLFSSPPPQLHARYEAGISNCKISVPEKHLQQYY